MRALDTNVLVRLVTADDPAQAKRAAEAFRSGRLWVAKTVLVETEWVLRYSYGLDQEAICGTFRKLLGYGPLEVEDRAAVLRALEWLEAGMDWADALHLASSGAAEWFVTFDRSLVARADSLKTAPPAELL